MGSWDVTAVIAAETVDSLCSLFKNASIRTSRATHNPLPLSFLQRFFALDGYPWFIDTHEYAWAPLNYEGAFFLQHVPIGAERTLS